MLRWLDGHLDDEASDAEASSSSSFLLYHQLSKATLFTLFVAESGFVQLLYTQHWSFLSAVQQQERVVTAAAGGDSGTTKASGITWFAPIAGLGSLASTLAGFSILPLVSAVGLPNLLIVASMVLIVACYCSDTAYVIAEEVSGVGLAQQRTRASDVECYLLPPRRTQVGSFAATRRGVMFRATRGCTRFADLVGC